MSRPAVSCTFASHARIRTHCSPRRRVPRRLAWAVAVALLTPAVLTADAASFISTSDAVGASVRTPSLVPVGKALPSSFSSREEGPLSPDRVLALGIALRPDDPQALRDFAVAVSSPGSRLYHRYLSPARFAAELGPSTATVQLVERNLRTLGLRVGTVSANRLLIPVRGSVRTIDTAFHTDIVRYQISRHSSGWVALTAPLVSRDVARCRRGSRPRRRRRPAHALDVTEHVPDPCQAGLTALGARRGAWRSRRVRGGGEPCGSRKRLDRK